MAFTALEERRIWSVSENLSSAGKVLLILKIRWACSHAILYAFRSRKLLISAIFHPPSSIFHPRLGPFLPASAERDFVEYPYDPAPEPPRYQRPVRPSVAWYKTRDWPAE